MNPTSHPTSLSTNHNMPEHVVIAQEYLMRPQYESHYFSSYYPTASAYNLAEMPPLNNYTEEAEDEEQQMLNRQALKQYQSFYSHYRSAKGTKGAKGRSDESKASGEVSVNRSEQTMQIDASSLKMSRSERSMEVDASLKSLSRSKHTMEVDPYSMYLSRSERTMDVDPTSSRIGLNRSERTMEVDSYSRHMNPNSVRKHNRSEESMQANSYSVRTYHSEESMEVNNDSAYHILGNTKVKATRNVINQEVRSEEASEEVRNLYYYPISENISSGFYYPADSTLEQTGPISLIKAEAENSINLMNISAISTDELHQMNVSGFDAPTPILKPHEKRLAHLRNPPQTSTKLDLLSASLNDVTSNAVSKTLQYNEKSRAERFAPRKTSTLIDLHDIPEEENMTVQSSMAADLRTTTHRFYPQRTSKKSNLHSISEEEITMQNSELSEMSDQFEPQMASTQLDFHVKDATVQSSGFSSLCRRFAPMRISSKSEQRDVSDAQNDELYDASDEMDSTLKSSVLLDLSINSQQFVPQVTSTKVDLHDVSNEKDSTLKSSAASDLSINSKQCLPQRTSTRMNLHKETEQDTTPQGPVLTEFAQRFVTTRKSAKAKLQDASDEQGKILQSYVDSDFSINSRQFLPQVTSSKLNIHEGSDEQNTTIQSSVVSELSINSDQFVPQLSSTKLNLHAGNDNQSTRKFEPKLTSTIRDLCAEQKTKKFEPKLSSTKLDLGAESDEQCTRRFVPRHTSTMLNLHAAVNEQTPRRFSPQLTSTKLDLYDDLSDEQNSTLQNEQDMTLQHEQDATVQNELSTMLMNSVLNLSNPLRSRRTIKAWSKYMQERGVHKVTNNLMHKFISNWSSSEGNETTLPNSNTTVQNSTRLSTRSKKKHQMKTWMKKMRVKKVSNVINSHVSDYMAGKHNKPASKPSSSSKASSKGYDETTLNFTLELPGCGWQMLKMLQMCCGWPKFRKNVKSRKVGIVKFLTRGLNPKPKSKWSKLQKVCLLKKEDDINDAADVLDEKTKKVCSQKKENDINSVSDVYDERTTTTAKYHPQPTATSQTLASFSSNFIHHSQESRSTVNFSVHQKKELKKKMKSYSQSICSDSSNVTSYGML